MKVMMMFFIRSGYLLIILVTILQQSKALPQLQLESSSTTDWDLLPSYTFQSYSSATLSPTFDFKNNPMTTRNLEELTSSDHTSIEISNGNFNKMTTQKHSLTEDSTRFFSMTSTPNSIGFHSQPSRSSCFSSHCRFEPSSSFTIFGTTIPILGRPTSNQLTPDSSSRRILSGSPLAGPTSAIKTSSLGFIIMADTTATTIASQQRLKKKRNKKRKRKKRKKKRKKKKSRRKGRRTSVEWEVEELRKTTQTATNEKNIRVKWVADHHRDQKYPTSFPTSITHPSLLKSVSFLAPVQRHVPQSSFSTGMTSQPISFPGVTEKTFQTIKSTPVFKASLFSIKQTMTFPNLISSRLLSDQLIKPHPPTTLSLTAQTSHQNELNQDHLHTTFANPSLTKNQIHTPITNSNTQESIFVHNYVTTPYFVAKSSELMPISQELNTLSSSFSFHSIHKSELQSSLLPLNIQLETSFSSLKSIPNQDTMFQPIMSSNMESLQSQSFSQIKISKHPTSFVQSSFPHSPKKQTTYTNSTNSVNSTKYTTLESILIFEARRPPIIEKSFNIDKLLTAPRFIDNSAFHSFSLIYSSNSLVEPELSQSVFSTISDKSVGETHFSSSLSVSDVSGNLNFMDFLAFFDTVVDYTKENSLFNEELPILSSSASLLVSSTPFLSSSVFPLSFHSQISANHEKTRKSADEELPLSSREIESKNHLLNDSEHFGQISFQSNSLDQSVYPSFLSDFLSNSAPSSRLHPEFTKESVEAKFSSFVDSLSPTITFPGDLFSDFALTDSSQSLSWPVIHSTTIFNDFLPLQTFSPLTFNPDSTPTPLLEKITFEPLVNQHSSQTLNTFGDEKNFNLVFNFEKRQSLKHSLSVSTSITNAIVPSITNNRNPSASLYLSLEQESGTSNFISSYSQKNPFSDDFSPLSTMMPIPESSHDPMDILSSSFLEISSSDLSFSEISLKTTTPNIDFSDMFLESSMLSIISSNKLSLSLVESYSQSLSSVLTTEGSSNMVSFTGDSTNTLFSTPELSNLFFPSTGVNPDSWAAPTLLTVDSGAFTTDSNSQLHVLVDRDVSITAKQLTSSEIENENGLLSTKVLVSTAKFTDDQKFSRKETPIASSLASDLHSQSKMSNVMWTFDLNTDDLIFTPLISSFMSPTLGSKSVDSSTVQLTPYMSSVFVLENSSVSPILMLPSFLLSEKSANAEATIDPAVSVSVEIDSTDPSDYSSSIYLDSENRYFPFSDKFLESSQSSIENPSSHLKSVSQMVNQSLSTSQAEKPSQLESQKSTLLIDSSSHLFSSFSFLEPSKVNSSQPMLLPVSSQVSFHFESSQLAQSVLLEPTSPLPYWLDSPSVSGFEDSDLTSSVIVEQFQSTSQFLFEMEPSELSSQVESSQVSELFSQVESVSMIDSISIESEYLPSDSLLSSLVETLQPTSQLKSIPNSSQMSSVFAFPAMTLHLSPQLTSEMTAQIIPSLSSQFPTQMTSQFISQTSLQFASEISTEIMPSLSQFSTQMSSQFTLQTSSQLISQISSEFTTQMSSQFTTEMSSQLTFQMSNSLQLTSQLDSSHLMLNLSMEAEMLQPTSLHLSSQTEFSYQTLQLSSELQSFLLKSLFDSLQSASTMTFQMQSLRSMSQMLLLSDLSNQISQLSSYSNVSHSLLHSSSSSSSSFQQILQSTPWFPSALEMSYLTKFSSQEKPFYSTSDLISQIMSSYPQSNYYSTFPFTVYPIHPKLNSSSSRLKIQSTLRTEAISISSFSSTLMPTLSVTETLNHEINSSLFYSTTKLANHTISDADKGTNPTTPLTITLPTTPEPLLNLSQAFQNYWVITVIKVRLSVNVTTMTFRRKMEHNLAQAYVEAYHRGERILNGTYRPLRKKRFALVKDVALQMINITRSQTKSSNNVTLVYYMEKIGKPVPAISAVRHLKLLQPQELAIYLKQVVVLPARTYLKPPHPEPSKDWIIGAVLGTLSSALLLIWCILFIYFKCFHMRPTKSIHTKSPTPQLVLSTSMQDINTDTSETVLIREEMQVQRQPSLLKKNGPKKQTYSVILPKVGRKNKREPEREISEKDISGKKKKVKATRKAVNGKISKKVEVKPEVKSNAVNDPPKQNGHVVMEHKEYSKETDNYSDYEVEPSSIEALPPLSLNGCISSERLSPFHYVNLPPIQHNFSLTASRQEADDELRHQADHLRRIQKQRLKEERRKMRHVELYQNSPHYFLNHGQDIEVGGSSLRTETADESYLEESRRGSRRRRYKRREKHDMSSQEDSSLNDVYDGDETWANQPEMLQRTREKMHKLLDDAFQLIAKHERKKVSPSINPLGAGCTRRSSIGKRRTRRQRTNLLETPTVSCHRKSSPSDSAPEEKLDRLHTPLFLHNHYYPCKRHRVNSAIPPPWNAAGDEAAKIAAEHQAWSSPYVSPRLNRSNILLDSSDPREEMRVPTINYPSDHNLTDFGCQPSFSFSRTRLSSQFSPYASSRQMFNNRHSGYHSMDNSDDTHTSLFQANSPCCPTNIETNIELNTFEPPSFAKHLSHSPGSSKTSPVDDEIDVIHNSVKQESSPQPLIQSIREELMRLSNEKGERNSLRSRIVFS